MIRACLEFMVSHGDSQKKLSNCGKGILVPDGISCTFHDTGTSVAKWISNEPLDWVSSLSSKQTISKRLNFLNVCFCSVLTRC